MNTVVRRAELLDAPAIARVHLAAHLEAYSHVIDPALLEDFTLEMREGVWAKSLEHGGSDVWVAERDGEIVGFSSSGPPRDDPPARPLELWSLYLLQSEHGSGAGQLLLDVAVADRPTSLWVLGQNPRARRFYERNGFALDGAQKLDARWNVVDLRMVR
ncbi:MAG: GNAT family N-acetyltransferase [Actinomycetota bacterium]